MSGFLWNILLALAWMGLTEEFTARSLAIGFILGMAVLFFARPVVGTPQYFTKMVQLIELALFLAWELLLANLRVAYDVVTPTHYMKPGVIGIPLEARTDLEITLLANLITLTPGTLSLDVSADRRVLYIHIMYIDYDDLDEVRRQIKAGYERRVLQLLR
ncbi:MAG TPA: Na+/H+ antiporter subunit E [Candidatus Eisenbacteria bacterium]|nr:Na+/H+ antiporter subunit E [Candidatus Eisenbacteria bacterium]